MSEKKQVNPDNFLVTVDDLGDILHPLFKKPFGRLLGEGLLSLLKVKDLNRIHDRYCHLRGTEVTKAILADTRINVTYTLHGGENLELMKDAGGFFTISNHPYGGLDGIILIDIIGNIRDDFKVLVNGFLNRITALKDYWIPVQPRVNKKNYVHDPSKNITGVRMVAHQIQEHHPVGMFPAGGVPHIDEVLGCPVEQLWQMNNVKIMKSAGVPIFPIMFEGNNSRGYYWFAKKYGYFPASILLPREITNKRGTNIDVYVGAPISVEEISATNDLRSARELVMRRSLGLLPSYTDIIDIIKFR